MSGAESVTAEADPTPSSSRLKLNRRTLILALPILLAVAAAGAWRLGIISSLHDASPHQPAPPVLISLPEMIANLNSDPRHPRYIKLKAQLEAPPADLPKIQAAMPKLVDVFQTYLREVRPEEHVGLIRAFAEQDDVRARHDRAVLRHRENRASARIYRDKHNHRVS